MRHRYQTALGVSLIAWGLVSRRVSGWIPILGGAAVIGRVWRRGGPVPADVAGQETLARADVRQGQEREVGDQPNRSNRLTSVGDKQDSSLPAGLGVVANGSWWQLLKQTWTDWQDDRASTLGAAMAYYSIFSLAPLLLFAVVLAGLFWDRSEVNVHLQGELHSYLGPEAAAGVRRMLDSAKQPTKGVIASTLGLLLLLWAASNLFSQLQDAMNTIWEVKPRPGRSWGAVVRQRFLAFIMVMFVGLLLLASMVMTTVIETTGLWMESRLSISAEVLSVLNLVGSMVVVTILFGVVFKYIPDVKVPWRAAWAGAVFTAVLFVVGKWLLGIYLSRGAVASAYGAAGSLVVVLLWVYYSAQLLFLGAEFTQAYSRARRLKVEPKEDAIYDPCHD